MSWGCAPESAALCIFWRLQKEELRAVTHAWKRGGRVVFVVLHLLWWESGVTKNDSLNCWHLWWSQLHTLMQLSQQQVRGLTHSSATTLFTRHQEHILFQCIGISFSVYLKKNPSIISQLIACKLACFSRFSIPLALQSFHQRLLCRLFYYN